MELLMMMKFVTIEIWIDIHNFEYYDVVGDALLLLAKMSVDLSILETHEMTLIFDLMNMMWALVLIL